MPALIKLAQEGRQYPGFLVVQPVADGAITCRWACCSKCCTASLEADSFSRRRDISLRRPWSRLVSSLADTRTSACRIDGSAQSGGARRFAALERVAETIVAALPEDALAALTTCQPIFSALGAAMSAATYLITPTEHAWCSRRRRADFRRSRQHRGSSFLKTLFCWLHRFLFASVEGNPWFTDRICDGGHVAAKRASVAVRQQREITPPPDSSAPQNPVMDKWLGYPGRLYNRR